jgi:hypothetical protein
MAARFKPSLRDLDLYISVTLSFTVAFLGLLGILDTRTVLAALLALVALLSLSILFERTRREDFLLALSPKRTWDQIRTHYIERLERARSVSIVAVSPIWVLRNCRKSLQAVVDRRGGILRFLIVDPDSVSMTLIEASRPEHRANARIAIAEVRRLATGSPIGRVELRTINFVPAAISTVMDADAIDGTIFVTSYSFDQSDPNRPSMVLTVDDGKWYTFYRNEFEAMWSAATVVQLQGK